MSRFSSHRNLIFAVVTVLIWSTLACVAKSMLSEIPNLEVLCLGGLFAFLFLLVFNLLHGDLPKLRNYSGRQLAAMAGLGFLGLFLYTALYYYGLSQLSSQEACILNYLWPIMVVLCTSLVMKEHLTPVMIGALLCSFTGIIILVSGDVPPAQASGHRALGIASCLLATVCYGLFSAFNKKAAYDQNITMMVIWLTVTVLSALLGIPSEDWVPLRGLQWLGMAWIGIMINAVAYLLWALAINGSKDTASLANIAFLTPFLSLLVSAAFLGERIEARAVLSLCFIIGGILLQNLCRRMPLHSAMEGSPRS